MIKRTSPIHTLRERQVALGICYGLTFKEIGVALGICTGTVAILAHNLYIRTGMGDRNEFALQQNAAMREHTYGPENVCTK